MSNISEPTERAREVVKLFYAGGARGDITSFADHLDKHWDISEGNKATRLLVAYFDARPLLKNAQYAVW